MGITDSTPRPMGQQELQHLPNASLVQGFMATTTAGTVT